MVWDPLVRIFHWSLAGFFFLAWVLENDWIAMHSHAGYTVALLVLFRLVWGVIGFRHARFATFVTSPARSVRHLILLVRGSAERHTGHDPAGSAMILLLLFSVLITALSGMSLFAMEGSGPLAVTRVADWPGPPFVEIHGFFADLSVVLVVLHVGGVILASFRQRENLVTAMVTGRKTEVRRALGLTDRVSDVDTDVHHGDPG